MTTNLHTLPSIPCVAAVEGPIPAISIPAGIIVGLLASFVQSLGLTIQRKSHVQNEELPEAERRAEYKRP